MAFKKIQSRQIDFTDFQTNNRLGIFMVDVENSSGSNTIFIERYDAIGNIDPVVQFATAEDEVDIVIEWEGVSTIWDGKIRINDSIITRDNPNANFEAIPNSRRFRCTISNFNVVDLEQIKLEVLNQNNVSLSENIVFVAEYIATDVILFNYDFGVLNEGELNNLRFYPFNNINVTSETPEPVEQSFLKEGDWVRITAEFDTIVSRVRIYDTNNVFFEDVENEIELDTPDFTFTDYLQVRETGNRSNVELIIQGYNPDTELWGILRSTNEDGDDLNMESIVNINNNLPTVSVAVTIDDATKSALNINDTATLDYTFPNSNFYWVNADFGSLNSKFTRNILSQNEELQVTLVGVNEYNLNQQFITPIISSLNGKTNTINATVPIASIAHTAIFTIDGETNNTDLYSTPTGKQHKLVATFNQQINTTVFLNVDIIETPDTDITLSAVNYEGNNKIVAQAQINDETLRGTDGNPPFKIRLTNVTNLAGIQQTFENNYIIRGFSERQISSGVVGQNFINLFTPGVVIGGINDEAGWQATLVNNGAPMNYKPWNGGTVLTSPAMQNVVITDPNDQYAYTYDPDNKQIRLSQYIINTVLNNIVVVSIKKN